MPRVAAVVGAGPVGCLVALSLAKMGWQVELYDGRSGEFSSLAFFMGNLTQGNSDAENELFGEANTVARRSINLAISTRGIAALEAVDSDMGRRVLQDMIPMSGRFIHRIDGSESRQPYDLAGQVRHLLETLPYTIHPYRNLVSSSASIPSIEVSSTDRFSERPKPSPTSHWHFSTSWQPQTLTTAF
jgi:2-polyprenyl-6-methoxyphenol hydroxylase-like FAD-dependent oxidoreductase